MRTLLLTAYDSAMAPIGDLTSPLMLRWANIHGFDFHCTRNLNQSCQSYWQKIWDIRTFTSPANPIRHNYDRVMWLDADQVISNPNHCPPWDSGFHASMDWGNDVIPDYSFSACGLVICQDALGIISTTARLYDDFKDTLFPEQSALQHVRQISSVLKGMMHIHPRRVFNSVPVEISEEAPEPWQPNDFAAHLTHVPIERRVELFHLIRERAPW